MKMKGQPPSPIVPGLAPGGIYSRVVAPDGSTLDRRAVITDEDAVEGAREQGRAVVRWLRDHPEDELAVYTYDGTTGELMAARFLMLDPETA